MSQHLVYRFDEFLLDPEAWSLSRRGNEIHLEPIVLELLLYLVTHRDRLVTRDELMDTVWGDTVISESALSKAVARLRKALGDDSATHRYLETVHSRGYRFVAAVEEVAPDGHREPAPARSRTPVLRRSLYAGVAAVAVLILLAVFWIQAPESDTPYVEDIRSLAVLPMNNLTGDPDQDYYVDGLQELLITELSQLPGLRVTSRQSTKRYRGSQLPTTDIATQLDVDALVEGSLLREGSRIELTVQLVHGQSDQHLWSERYTRETPDVFSLIADAAQAIGSEIGVLSAVAAVQPTANDRVAAVDARAIDAYSLGLTHLDRFTADDIRFAIDQFETAVAIEPEFALAWGHLAAAHAMHALYGFAPPRESIEKARAAALQAIESDDQFYIGYSTLGWVRLWTGDLAGACDSFEKALRLNPSAPYALHGDADCLMLDGRIDDSIARTRDLLLVGPFSAMHNRPLPYHLFLARRYDEAVKATREMQVRVPGFSVHWLLARIYWQQGLFDQALEEERLELERRGDTVLLVSLEEGVAAGGGPTGGMLSLADAMVARARESYADPFRIAETYARAGVVDEALQWLDLAVEQGSYETTYIALQPEFDILRNDSRFQDLQERVYGQRIPEITWPDSSQAVNQ